MILQNKDGENKIFIDENLEEYIDIDYINSFKRIEFECDSPFKMLLIKENITLICVDQIEFNIEENELCFYNDDNVSICEKIIGKDEIISLSLGKKDEIYQTVEITTVKFPKFLFEKNYDEKYPKFEINLSDCIYSMKIYTGECHLDIPEFQSHNSIYETLNHISNLVFYLTLGRPDFLSQLCDHDEMDVLIYDRNHDKVVASGNMKYKLGEDGLYLTGGELENYLVEWQKFFKLVMDQTWEVDFET